MKFRVLLISSFLASSIAAAASVEARRPSRWGGGPKGYEVQLDNEVKLSGSASVSLTRTSKTDKPKFGTIVQAFSAEAYAGERIRFSGFIKSRDVESAGLWLRVDSEKRGTVGFDNMQTRRITGTNNWYKYEIVLDVDDDASMITFGALLSGPGKIWIDDLTLTEVNDDVEATVGSMRPTMHNIEIPANLADQPQNMDFEI